MPEDLKEVATSFHLKGFNRLRWLYLPGVFPYLITGMVSAAGGAWNASIIAEYISYNGKVSTIPGLGSMISESAANGNIPLLTAGVCVMVIVVTFINLSFWLRLYHYSEKRFTLNY